MNGGVWDKLEHQLIDTHCHILDYNCPDLLNQLKHKQITVHAVTTTLDEFKNIKKIVADHPNIHPSLGLFPLKVPDECDSLEEILEHIETTKFIGEIGLDYTVLESERIKQREVLKLIVAKCDKIGNRVLSLHSRGSAEDTLNIIGKNFNGTAIMHWFSGKPEFLKNCPDNVFFSINTAMIKSRKGKEIIKAIKPSQVLTETDGPYVQINGQPTYPWDIKNVIQTLSLRWDKSIQETLKIVSDNYRRAVNFYGV